MVNLDDIKISIDSIRVEDCTKEDIPIIRKRREEAIFKMCEGGTEMYDAEMCEKAKKYLEKKLEEIK